MVVMIHAVLMRERLEMGLVVMLMLEAVQVGFPRELGSPMELVPVGLQGCLVVRVVLQRLRLSLALMMGLAVGAALLSEVVPSLALLQLLVSRVTVERLLMGLALVALLLGEVGYLMKGLGASLRREVIAQYLTKGWELLT